MEFITSIDFTILNWIQDNLRVAFLDPIMAGLGYVGEAGIIWIALAIVLLFFKKHRATGVIMLAAMAIGFLCGDIIIKHLVARPRPFTVNNFPLFVNPPSSFSFPSGHSTCAFAASVSILLRNRKLGIPALILALLIAFSRLYIYVHYPSDVLCGIILGTLVALLVSLIFKKTGLADRISGIKKSNK
ncbi:MAG: phosphatase PAP2 family protein [Ruminococcus sp.]|nr:phosphatase PAP2 family protein [Ruminococcus sp.]